MKTLLTRSFNYVTVLRRNFTCEELLSPGAPFTKRVLTVSYRQGFIFYFFCILSV